jgi:hypothetical protein
LADRTNKLSYASHPENRASAEFPAQTRALDRRIFRRERSLDLPKRFVIGAEHR